METIGMFDITVNPSKIYQNVKIPKAKAPVSNDSS